MVPAFGDFAVFAGIVAHKFTEILIKPDDLKACLSSPRQTFGFHHAAETVGFAGSDGQSCLIDEILSGYDIRITLAAFGAFSGADAVFSGIIFH